MVTRPDDPRELAQDALLVDLLMRLDADCALDVDAFLACVPEHEDALRARLAKLAAVGLLPNRRHPAPDAAVADDELPRDTVVAGRYRVLDPLGRGGMGCVYAAHDDALGCAVALKVLRADARADPARLAERVERFRAEAEVIAQLDHPGIVPVHDCGCLEDGRPFYTMKIVEGRTLLSIIEGRERGDPETRREFPRDRCVAALERVCDTLAFAHARDVLHRDVKPDNVMIGSFGAVFLLDWGLARRIAGAPDEERCAPALLTSRDDPASPTLTGDLIGTLAYMAPEQARGEAKSLGPPADVFGVGATLHRLLFGRAPVEGGSSDAVLARLRDGYVGVAPRRRDVPRELDAVCRKALAGDPATRYASAESLAADLRAYREGTRGAAWRDGPVGRTVKWVRRKPAAAVVIAAAFAIVAVLSAAHAALTVEREQRAAAERRHAVQELPDRVLRLQEAETDGANLTNVLVFSRTAEDCLDLLREWGVDVEGDDADKVVASLGSVPEPEVRTRLVEIMFSAIRCVGMAGLAFAWEYEHADERTPKEVSRWRRMGERYPRLFAAWPRLVACVERLPGHDAGKRAVRAYRSYLTRHELTPTALAGSIDGSSVAELDMLTFVAVSARLPKAVALVEEALRLHPGGYWLHDRRAHLAIAEDDEATAWTHWTAAHALWPEGAGARTNLAVLTEDPNERVRLLLDVLADHPDAYAPTRALAQGRYDQTRYDEALSLISEMLARGVEDDDLSDFLLLRARCLTRLAERGAVDLEAAIEAYAEMRTQCPDRWEGHHNAGRLLLDAGRFEDALAAFDDARRAGADDPAEFDETSVMTDRSVALWEQGHRLTAVESLVAFLERQAGTADFGPAVDTLREYRAELAPREIPRALLERLDRVTTND